MQPASLAATSGHVNANDPPSTADSGSSQWALRDLNPRPHGCDPSGAGPQVLSHQANVTRPDPACTTACTSNPETAHGTDLEALVEAMFGLAPGDRARLSALLVGRQRKETNNG